MLLQMEIQFPANWLQGYKKVNPLFVPKLLINLGAGHISMKYGFMVCSESAAAP
jgi:hypothetical protein